MPPPLELSRRQLPLRVLESGARLVRLHTVGKGPLFFGPASSAPARGRWDAGDGRFGTCCLAEVAHAHVAFGERFLRDPERTLIPDSEIRRAAVSVVEVLEPIEVVAFHGPSLRRLGASAAVAHGDHRESRLWASALYQHPAGPAGICWRSRVDDDGFAVALFDRARRALRVVGTEPLLGSGATFDLEACLERYGAAVVEARS